MLVNR